MWLVSFHFQNPFVDKKVDSKKMVKVVEKMISQHPLYRKKQRVVCGLDANMEARDLQFVMQAAVGPLRFGKVISCRQPTASNVNRPGQQVRNVGLCLCRPVKNKNIFFIFYFGI